MLPLCADQGVAVIPWSPLARGRLARAWGARSTTVRGRGDAYGEKLYGTTEDADHRVVDVVAKVSTARGVSQAQVALAWLLSKAVVTAPIVGATKPEHLEDAVAALNLRLAPEELAALEGPYVPHAVAGIS